MIQIITGAVSKRMKVTDPVLENMKGRGLLLSNHKCMCIIDWLALYKVITLTALSHWCGLCFDNISNYDCSKCICRFLHPSHKQTDVNDILEKYSQTLNNDTNIINLQTY